MEENGSAGLAMAGSATENPRPARKGRWYARRGVGRADYILPQSLCDRAELLCRSHPQKTVADLLKIEPATLTRLKQRGFRASVGKRLRARPADFAIQANAMNTRELAAHYSAGSQTVSRWCAEIARVPEYRAGLALPVPSMEAMRAAIAATATYDEAARHIGVSLTTFRKWRRLLGLDRQAATTSTAAGWAECYFADRKTA